MTEPSSFLRGSEATGASTSGRTRLKQKVDPLLCEIDKSQNQPKNKSHEDNRFAPRCFSWDVRSQNLSSWRMFRQFLVSAVEGIGGIRHFILLFERIWCDIHFWLINIISIISYCDGKKWKPKFYASWDLFLENGTKWEVEGGLGEYGCKRRPDESVQVIGEHLQKF